jgi:uncharacterized membrane protein YfcA
VADPMLITLLAALALFLGQLVKGTTGFGGALVSVLLLNWLIPPVQAIFLTACIDILGGGILLAQVRKHMRWSLVLVLFLPLVMGQYVGTGLLVRLPVDVVKMLVGAFIGLMGLRWVIQPIRAGIGELEDLPEQSGGLLFQAGIVGTLGGLCGGLMGASGPPVILFMKRHFQDRFVRTTLIGTFFLGACSMAAMLWMRDATPPEVFEKLPWVVPGAIAGNLLGSRLADRVPRAAFARMVGALLLLSGAGLVLRALI